MTAQLRGDGAPDFTVVTCHFGDLFWLEQLTGHIARNSDRQPVEILVADQDRDDTSAAALAALPRVARVVRYPAHAAQIGVLGHDHPDALNRLVREPIVTSHVIVMDSDCLPLGRTWLEQVARELETADAVLAVDPGKWGLSHPCFMVLPTAVCETLDFAEGTQELGMDTGRLIATQLVRRGVKVRLLRADRAFHRQRGHFYLNGLVYHHGSGSFVSSSDPRLRRAVDERIERFFRRKVAAGSYRLSAFERAVLQARALVGKARRR